MNDPFDRWLSRVAVVVLVLLAILGAGGDWFAPYDPDEQLDTLSGRLRPPFTTLQAVELSNGVWLLAEDTERVDGGLWIERLGERRFLAEETVRNLAGDGVADRRFFLFGSDEYGRDIFSRWLYGARLSLLIGVLSMVLAMTLGVLVGTVAAVGGRFVDGLLMRLVDGLLAFPWIFLVITLGALMPGGGPWVIILLLGTTSWMSAARLARGQLLGLIERDFVVAVRGLGATMPRIVLRHLLPNALPPLMITATLRVGGLILFESALSFLGLGVQPPHASWGNMLADGRDVLLDAWWVTAFPGLGLVAVVLSLNLVSDALRDLLDPRQRHRRDTGAGPGEIGSVRC